MVSRDSAQTVRNGTFLIAIIERILTVLNGRYVRTYVLNV
jgi:hypothetical protein